ncbi:EspF repeat-containing protein [Thalassospira sp. UBA4513]|nr:hypothetical protein [Thalassospira sp. ER-Se-21-Dark]
MACRGRWTALHPPPPVTNTKSRSLPDVGNYCP